MLKFTKTSVIAFDFKEALAFEGETGPYAQYAAVRATNILRKAGIEPEQALEADVGFRFLFLWRDRYRNLGALAAGREDLIRDRAEHCHHRAGILGQTCLPVGAAVQ